MTATAQGTPRPRPSQARARTAPGATAAEPAPPLPAVLRFTSVSDEPEQREPLFYIDDVEYTIPVEPPAGIGLEAMHMIAQGGPAAGAAVEDYIMGEMLGEDGWAALRECRTLKMADYRRLVQVCTEKVMGAEEDPNR